MNGTTFIYKCQIFAPQIGFMHVSHINGMRSGIAKEFYHVGNSIFIFGTGFAIRRDGKRIL